MPTADVKALPKVTLLCIDDDDSLLEYEKSFLEISGYAVVTAHSGREGLELASLHSFDLVIVDYCMTEMNGLEFAIAMRRLWPRVPIIMLSGTVDLPAQVSDAVDAFVAKDRLANELLPAITLLTEENSNQNKHPINGAIWRQ
jgi:DNA-binding response OmpR family regulator